MYNKRIVGSQWEQKAKEYLLSEGFIIVHQNFLCKSGEIDIIAKEDNYLVFIEVKYRTSIKMGYPEEAIHLRKRLSIVKTARYYMLINGITENIPCRFDVVVILGNKINLIRNAFDAFWFMIGEGR